MTPSTHHNLEAEKSLLGGIFYEPSVLADVRLSLRFEDFFGETNRRIYQAMLALEDRHESIDVITVASQLGEWHEKIGGDEALMNLADYTPSAAGAKSHAELISEAAIRRRLATAGKAILEQSAEAATAEEALTESEKLLYEVRDRRGIKVTPVADAQITAIARTERIRKEAGETVGIPTGFAMLDRNLYGLCPGKLYILAGRTSNGKTALALNVAFNVSRNAIPALYFSLEMSSDDLVTREWSRESRVNYKKIRQARMDLNEWARVGDSWGPTGDAALNFLEPGRITVPQIASLCRSLKRRGQLDLIVIDYLQRLSMDGMDLPRNTARYQQVGEASRRFKELALELNVPILLLSQVRRSEKPGNPPTLSDLKESGDIENDADVVILIHRLVDNAGEFTGDVELLVEKHRDGETGKLDFRFDGAHQRFFEAKVESNRPWEKKRVF